LEAIASRCIDASTATSGPLVFTVRFGAFGQGHRHVHRYPSNVRDHGRRPSDQDGMAEYVSLILIL
ncbi:hypothetical protein, partial [Bradyrhizobium sp. LjRoot220]|uniref:hypothetical protein n=1 Tax=Bradyrhizobium sp. LjRoot220 TaxID=3342284 RepID=UPI003F5086D0